jgi:steroid delta-isomerase-like uncharacterized protein
VGENSDLIRRFYGEVLGQGNLDVFEELASDDIVDHEEGLPGQPSGKEGVRFFINAMRDAFSDIKADVDPMLDEGNLGAARTLLTATHTGEFMGVPATNKSVEFESVDIIRLEDGKVAEHWGVTDVMSLMQQLGAIPES